MNLSLDVFWILVNFIGLLSIGVNSRPSIAESQSVTV